MNPRWIFPALLLLTACEMDVTQDYDIPYEEKLVLEAFISPQDTLIEVKVTKTEPVTGIVSSRLGVSGRVLPDARVVLSDGTREVTVPYVRFSVRDPLFFGSQPDTARRRDVGGYYLPARQFPIVPGRTYTLRVSTPAGLRAEAECTVPTPAVTERDVRTVRGTTREAGISVPIPTLTVKLKDVNPTPNYYAVVIWENQESRDNRGQLRFERRYTLLQSYLSDENRDGDTLSAPRAKAYNLQPQLSRWELFVATTDEAFYRYNTTLTRHNEAQYNPFAEPQPVYSNVRGGLGVFAAYQVVKVPVAW